MAGRKSPRGKAGASRRILTAISEEPIDLDSPARSSPSSRSDSQQQQHDSDCASIPIALGETPVREVIGAVTIPSSTHAAYDPSARIAYPAWTAIPNAPGPAAGAAAGASSFAIFSSSAAHAAPAAAQPRMRLDAAIRALEDGHLQGHKLPLAPWQLEQQLQQHDAAVYGAPAAANNNTDGAATGDAKPRRAAARSRLLDEVARAGGVGEWETSSSSSGEAAAAAAAAQAATTVKPAIWAQLAARAESSRAGASRAGSSRAGARNRVVVEAAVESDDEYEDVSSDDAERRMAIARGKRRHHAPSRKR